MKTLKILLIFSISFFIISCSSTGSRYRTKLPMVNVISKTPYVWDNTKSEALNISTIANPAGVGQGMIDYSDGKLATNRDIGSGGRLLGNALMGISWGIFGIFANESVVSDINNKRHWKPTIVDFIPVSELDISSPNAFKKVQSYIGNKIKDSLQKEYPNLTWYGSFTARNKRITNFNTDYLMYSPKLCENALKFGTNEEFAAPLYQTTINSNVFIEPVNHVKKYCEYGFKIQISSTIVRNEKSYYVVVATNSFGALFNQLIAKHYDGYVLFPNAYSFKSKDKKYRVFRADYTKVYHSGLPILFQIPSHSK